MKIKMDLETSELLQNAAQRSITYLDKIAARKVAPSPEAIDGLSILREPLPANPAPAEDVLRLLDEVCSPATMGMAGPRFFGFVIGGSLPVTLAANWLAGAWDQNSALYNVTPATALLEQVALGWLLDLFELPPAGGGAFVTGATMANFCAMAAARHAVLHRAGWNVEADGLFGAPRSRWWWARKPIRPSSKPSGCWDWDATAWSRFRWMGRAGCGQRLSHRFQGQPSFACRLATSTVGLLTPSPKSLPAPTRPAPGCTWTGPSACGQPPPRPASISPPGWQTPTRGPRTPTSG